jgi:hypothetical protein
MLIYCRSNVWANNNKTVNELLMAKKMSRDAYSVSKGIIPHM